MQDDKKDTTLQNLAVTKHDFLHELNHQAESKSRIVSYIDLATF